MIYANADATKSNAKTRIASASDRDRSVLPGESSAWTAADDRGGKGGDEKVEILARLRRGQRQRDR